MGGIAGLGWIEGRVRRLTPADPAAKVPHMGWNDVTPAAPHPLIEPGEAYFLHSYAFEGDDVVATTDHAGPVTAAIGARQYGRRAIPPRKEPALRARRCSRGSWHGGS